MTRTIRTLACFFMCILPVTGWALDGKTYALASIARPGDGSCNGYMHYTINKKIVTKPTAVLLYHLIRFTYGVEEPSDPDNTYYKNQFGFNPSNLRINQYTHETTIVPPTVDEMIDTLGDPALTMEKSTEDTKASLDYLNPHLDYQLRPAVRAIVRYRHSLATGTDLFDRDPATEYKKAVELLKPIVDFYNIRIKTADGDCQAR